jgi:signal transduction histidine kinase
VLTTPAPDKGTDAACDRNEAERLRFIVHELRNALTAAAVSFQALRTTHVGLVGRAADALERSLQRQKDLIDYLSNHLRLSSGELTRVPFTLAQLLDEVAVATERQARAKKLRVVVEAEGARRVEADRLLLTSAVMHVTLNAVKYTRDGGQITLRAGRHDGGTVIEVEDQCGGLPDGDRKELFQPLVRRHTPGGGLGLGLALARQAMEAHGGSIAVRNLPGQGCVFVLRLP